MTPLMRASFYGVSVFIVIADQISKAMILGIDTLNAEACLDRTIRCGRIELSPVFDLSMVWNRGVSFGTLQAEGVTRWLLVILTVTIGIGFAIWLYRASRKVTGLALALVVGGAVGNVIDRVRFGAVVDFLDFSDIYFIWVFNVADAAITVGAILLFIDQFLISRNDDIEKSLPEDI